MNSKMKVMSYSEAATPGDVNDGDSGFMDQFLPRVPGSGTFPIGNLPLSGIGDHALFSGQMISPTHPQGHIQYMQPQVQLFVS